MSRFQRLWQFVTRPTGYVGRDLQGNKYYERVNLNNPMRPKRSVKPVDYDDYIARRDNVPAQWYSWLSFTRLDPPTLQELQADTMRQQRLAQNVALIEERDREEQLLLEQQRQAAPQQLSQPSEPVMPQEMPNTEQVYAEKPSKKSKIAQDSPSPLPKTGSDEYQPESWVPKSTVRRGS